jgi:DMSO/TMAO reductase YedYZ heme-binding membrane subunit
MPPSGPTLTLALGTALVVMAGLVLETNGIDEPGVRALIRATARSSVLLFVLAFVARPLREVWRHDSSGWLLRNRRYVGLGFAISHALHGLALVWFATAHPEAYRADVATSTVVLGGIGFAFAAAMAATSNDASVRALGRRRWQGLHRTGIWWLFGVFFATFAGAFAGSPNAIYGTVSLVLLAALGLRIGVFLRARGRRNPTR